MAPFGSFLTPIYDFFTGRGGTVLYMAAASALLVVLTRRWKKQTTKWKRCREMEAIHDKITVVKEEEEEGENKTETEASIPIADKNLEDIRESLQIVVDQLSEEEKAHTQANDIVTSALIGVSDEICDSGSRIPLEKLLHNSRNHTTIEQQANTIIRKALQDLLRGSKQETTRSVQFSVEV